MVDERLWHRDGSSEGGSRTTSKEARGIQMDKQSFLERVRQPADLGTSKESEHHTVAVVVALSHLLSDSAWRRHFARQLPGFLKSPLLAEARPAPVEWTRDGFVQHVASELDTHAARAERAVAGHIRKDCPHQ